MGSHKVKTKKSTSGLALRVFKGPDLDGALLLRRPYLFACHQFAFHELW